MQTTKTEIFRRVAAAAAKLLQSCLTLSDPMDCSLPGSSIHRIFQASVLEWVAISFLTAVKNLPNISGDAGLIPELGRSPEEGNSNLLQHLCLKNPMDRGACGLQSMGSQGSSDMTQQLTTRFRKTINYSMQLNYRLMNIQNKKGIMMKSNSVSGVVILFFTSS